MILRAIKKLLIWILRKIRKEQIEQAKMQEEILQLKKKREDDAAYDEWKEKLDRAYRECSSYGKKRTSQRNYYHHRRKSAH